MEAPPTDPRHVLDVKTLEMLVCPLTKTRLILSSDRTELISVAARLAFPIVKGVPLLSLDEARNVEPESLRRLQEVKHELMTYFNSSAISRAEYDPEERLLLLWFAGDEKPYGYRDVPEAVYRELCEAESQGRYFAARIRDQYETIPPA